MCLHACVHNEIIMPYVSLLLLLLLYIVGPAPSQRVPRREVLHGAVRARREPGGVQEHQAGHRTGTCAANA